MSSSITTDLPSKAPESLDVWCKICGITTPEDAAFVSAYDAVDALGLNFYAKSPRYIDGGIVTEIAAASQCQTVGLFIDPEPAQVEATLKLADLDMLQFQGNETEEFCSQFGLPYLKGVRVRSKADIGVAQSNHAAAWGLLLDAYVEGEHGGTGQQFDWAAWPQDAAERLIVAGGLTPENVGGAISVLKPFGVDVCSGVNVEGSKTRKDPERVGRFVDAVVREVQKLRGLDEV